MRAGTETCPRLGAEVLVTNNTDQAHGYTVHVVFDDQTGTTQLDTGVGTQATVQPHEQSAVYAIGTGQAPTYKVLDYTGQSPYRFHLTGVTQDH